MKNVLYIGNNLSSKSTNLSSIQVLGSLLEQDGFHLRYASHFRNRIFRLLHMIFCVVWNGRRIDYVIIDTYSTHNFYYAFIISQLCKLLKLKYIPNLNGGNLPSRLKANPRLCSMIFDHSLINVSPSYYLKDAFGSYGYDNVRYIPNSIEIDNYSFDRKSFDTLRLLWVRSFSRIYNPLLAIRILKKLKDLDNQCELCMIGPNSDGILKHVKDLAQKLEVDVTFTGKLPKKEWISMSKNYNLFINTTDFDNTPVSVIEAMALGLPVISTNVGGIPYLIQDHHDGILVERNDLDGFVLAVLNLYNNPEFASEIAENARKKVEQFDWDRVKSRWFEILA
ncbi:MAG: glycosyltransferase family 4 protein [Bacteroidia bacterium]|nr:glycosyltransferase family 4 protein [Bacteroidia bacterium]